MSYGWCQQQCINVPGGYECGCIDGYSLQDNTITCAGNVLSLHWAVVIVMFSIIVPLLCIDINECNLANGNCDHTCFNTEGSFYCVCNEGFLLLEDKLGCTGNHKNSDHTSFLCYNNVHCSCGNMLLSYFLHYNYTNLLNVYNAVQSLHYSINNYNSNKFIFVIIINFVSSQIMMSVITIFIIVTISVIIHKVAIAVPVMMDIVWMELLLVMVSIIIIITDDTKVCIMILYNHPTINQ